MERCSVRGIGGQGHDIRWPGLEPLLVLDPEALFLIHNQQPQILKGHIFLQQTMGADDIQLAASSAAPATLSVPWRCGSGKASQYGNRVLFQTVAEGLKML